MTSLWGQTGWISSSPSSANGARKLSSARAEEQEGDNEKRAAETARQNRPEAFSSSHRPWGAAMATGTVKWFNNAKGYGFVLAESNGEDLFIHYSSIQMDGYKSLKAGQLIEYDVQEGPKGLHAVNIRCAAAEGQAATPSSTANPAENPATSSDEDLHLNPMRSPPPAGAPTEPTPTTSAPTTPALEVEDG